MRMRLVAVGFLALGLCAVGCSPATQYNKGIEMSYHPSGKADGQARLVSSAIELKQDSDQNTIKEAGGVYLGELEVIAAKSSDFSGGAGGKSLSGRVSLEAANRGATHFYLAASDVEHTVERASGPTVSFGHSGGSSESVARTKARFVLYRVEQDKWAALPKNYQPEAMPGTAPPVAKAAEKTGDGATTSDANAKTK
jgi:hypothetical protein